MSTIETDVGTIDYTFPGNTVSVCDKIGDEWTEVPYLYCNSINRRVGPAVDEAEFSYRYGKILREDKLKVQQYDPLQLEGKWVKVEIEATVEDDDPILWYGRFEFDARDVAGSSSKQSRGEQKLHAFGLLRQLERAWIFSAVLEAGPTDTGDTIRINRGLTFNCDDKGAVPAAWQPG